MDGFWWFDDGRIRGGKIESGALRALDSACEWFGFAPLGLLSLRPAFPCAQLVDFSPFDCRHTFIRMHNHQKPLLSRYSYMLYAQVIATRWYLLLLLWESSIQLHLHVTAATTFSSSILLFLPDMYNEMSEPKGKGEAVARCIKFQPTQISGSGRQGQKWDLFLSGH